VTENFGELKLLHASGSSSLGSTVSRLFQAFLSPGALSVNISKVGFKFKLPVLSAQES